MIQDAHHCSTCTCTYEVAPEPSLPPWLWVLTRCIDGTICMWCGSEPFSEEGDHVEGCPTIDTCAQFNPNRVSKPWHHFSDFEDVTDRWRSMVGPSARERHLQDVHGIKPVRLRDLLPVFTASREPIVFQAP